MIGRTPEESAFDPLRTLQPLASAFISAAMTARLIGTLVISLTALTACRDPYVIVETAPFEHLTCQPTDVPKLRENSASFAKAAGLRYSTTDFAILLANKRLNFTLIWSPEGDYLWASGITRTEAGEADKALFSRFLSDLSLTCRPASD